MKILVRTLKGEHINIDISSEATIQDVKEQIKKEKGLNVQTQKIIYKGKTVNNNDTLNGLGVKENEVLGVLIEVKKGGAQKKQQTKIEQKKEQIKVPQPSQTDKPKQKQPQLKPKTEKKTQQQILQEQQRQTQINQLMMMGFDRQKAIAALRAAYFNTDRAVQYLINGIPKQHRQQPNLDSTKDLSVSEAENMFKHYLKSPQLAPLKMMVRNNPQALQQILAELQKSQPNLYAYIVQFPQAFEKAVMEQPVPGTQTTQNPQQPQQPQQPQHPQHPQAPPGTIFISPVEKNAIHRLMNFGFSQIQAAQAYFACDKNQQLAANLLFDRLANGDIEDQGDISGHEQPKDKNHPKDDEGDDDDNLFN